MNGVYVVYSQNIITSLERNSSQVRGSHGIHGLGPASRNRNSGINGLNDNGCLIAGEREQDHDNSRNQSESTEDDDRGDERKVVPSSHDIDSDEDCSEYRPKTDDRGQKADEEGEGCCNNIDSSVNSSSPGHIRSQEEAFLVGNAERSEDVRPQEESEGDDFQEKDESSPPPSAIMSIAVVSKSDRCIPDGLIELDDCTIGKDLCDWDDSAHVPHVLHL